MKVSFSLILIFTSNFSFSLAGKYNISYEVLDRCKEYDAINGYNYQDYFKLSEFKHIAPEDDNELLRINLVILGSKDALILLSPSNENDPSMGVYEIVLGAGSNTFCEIRRKRKMNPLKTKRMEILSAIDPVPIVIRIEKSGLIEVKVKGEGIMPILSANDTELITNIQYLAFSTWGSTNVRFFYDCPGDDGQILEEAEIKDTKTRILHDILRNHDPFTIPDSADEVMLGNFSIKNILYDERTAILNTRLSIDLAWNDSTLMWNTSDYEQVKMIRNPTRNNFWRPSIMLLNGAGDLNFRPLDFSFTLFFDGTVKAESKDFDIQTFCELNNTSTNNNVFENECTIQILADGVSLAGFEGSLNAETVAQSSWKLYSVTENDHFLSDASPFLFDIVEHFMANRTFVTYTLKLRKNQHELRFIYSAPLFAAMIMLMISLVTRKYVRHFLVFTAKFIIFLTMIEVERNATPATFLIKIGHLLNELIVMAWLTFVMAMIATVLIQYPPKHHPPFWLARIINYPWLRLSVGLGRSGSYDYLHEKEFAWTEISSILDRIWLLVLIIYGTYMACVL